LKDREREEIKDSGLDPRGTTNQIEGATTMSKTKKLSLKRETVLNTNTEVKAGGDLYYLSTSICGVIYTPPPPPPLPPGGTSGTYLFVY